MTGFLTARAAMVEELAAAASMLRSLNRRSAMFSIGSAHIEAMPKHRDHDPAFRVDGVPYYDEVRAALAVLGAVDPEELGRLGPSTLTPEEWDLLAYRLRERAECCEPLPSSTDRTDEPRAPEDAVRSLLMTNSDGEPTAPENGRIWADDAPAFDPADLQHILADAVERSTVLEVVAAQHEAGLGLSSESAEVIACRAERAVSRLVGRTVRFPRPSDAAS